MASNAKLVCSLLHVSCHPMVPGTSRWTWWWRRRDFGEWEEEGWVRRASRRFSSFTRHSWCKSLKCSPGWMPPSPPTSPRASPPYYLFAVLLLLVYWKLKMWRRLAQMANPWNALQAIARQPIHSPGRTRFASITTEYSMSFRVLTASEFGRAQNYWTTGEGEGGETHWEFFPPPPPSLNYFGLAKRITSMAASDILTYGAFDLRTCWTEIRR